MNRLMTAACVGIGVLLNGPAEAATLTAHWALDETAGLTAADSVGGANPGTLINMGGTEWTVGKVDGALQLDGLNDFVSVADPGTPPFSLAFWMQPDLVSNNRRIFSNIDSTRSVTAPLFALQFVTGNRIQLYDSATPGWQNLSTREITTGSWWHVAVTVDALGVTRGYINGSNETAFTASIELHQLGLGAGLIVSEGGPFGDEFSGLLDDVRVYDGVLDASEVEALYVAGDTYTSTSSSTSTSTDTSSTSTSSTTTDTSTTTTSSTTAPGFTYFVRITGFDSADGLQPTGDTTHGPKRTLGSAVSAANAVDGYHTIDIGAGTFTPSDLDTQIGRTMRLTGQGPGQTVIDRQGLAVDRFSLQVNALAATATHPLVFKDLTFANTTGDANSGNILIVNGASGGLPHFVRFENVALDDYQDLYYGIRPNAPATLIDVAHSDWTFKDVSATNIAAGGSSANWLFLRNASGARARHQRWVWDGATITDNETIYGGLGDNRWVGSSFQLLNSTWSRNSGYGCFALNNCNDRDILGTNVIDTAIVEDNNQYGIWANRMGADAGLIIRNSTLRDTPAVHAQYYNVYMTIPEGITLGQIRMLETDFDSDVGGIGVYIQDDGATQTSPIELRNVTFGNCATGLVIVGTSANLWYLAPERSGATIEAGGTLVSGGRKTYYGDINLDGVVNTLDTEIANPFYPMATGATWATGDFDFDGDFDATDLAWLPALPGAVITVR